MVSETLVLYHYQYANRCLLLGDLKKIKIYKKMDKNFKK